MSKPIPDHRYHKLSEHQLRYIIENALDQVNDARAVLAWRRTQSATAAPKCSDLGPVISKPEGGMMANAWNVTQDEYREAERRFKHVAVSMTDTSAYWHLMRFYTKRPFNRDLAARAARAIRADRRRAAFRVVAA